MVRKLTLTFILLVACTCCAALAWHADNARAQEGGAESGFKPVASVHALMNGNALLLRQIGQAIQNPATKHREERISAFSELLAELANLNHLKGEKEDYKSWARDLQKTALELSGEAEKKGDADDEKMNALVERLKATCTACHDVYQEKD